MFTSINRTVFEIPLTWDRAHFEASRNKCRQARKLVESSINAQFNKQLREVFLQKLDIEKNINESQEHLGNHEKKMRVLDNLTDVASESLTDYFDKRMENVRIVIQEHCNAIQQILSEENEHWKEIHTAIDQNLITSDDIHPRNNIDHEIPLANIHTINEVDEEEGEHTCKLLNNKTVTPLLTQMIRKSRLQSNRRSTTGPNLYTSTEKLIPSKEERFSVILPLTSARRTLRVIDTTFVIKIEESKTIESNESLHDEVVTLESHHDDILPNESHHDEVVPNESYHDEVMPIESIPTINVEITPSYSQPKPPARLYFSPTLLQDHEESEPIQTVLSNIDQNQTNIEKPKLVSRRFGQTFLLDNVKTEDISKDEDRENLRPRISDEIPMIIPSNPSIIMQKQCLDESHHVENSDQKKPMVHSKRPTRTKRTKVETEPIHLTRRITKKQNQIDTNQRQTRKRKKSIADDGNDNTVVLRKKKPVPSPAKTNTKKKRVKKTKEVPIREPSPLPIIDRSKHYSTRFSTRSHRFNNMTLSTTAINVDDDNNNYKSKYSSTRLRTKSMRRTPKHDDDSDDETIIKKRLNVNKNQTKTRAKSMMVTRNRRK